MFKRYYNNEYTASTNTILKDARLKINNKIKDKVVTESTH